MTNYVELSKDSWEELRKWVDNREFDPETEADIQCFLYRCFVESLGTAKDIHAEYEYEQGRRRRPDLVIADKVFVEIKYILRSRKRTKGQWKTRRRDAEKAIERLRSLMRKYSATGILAIFAKSYKKEDELWYDAVEESCEKSGIIMLRAWKS